MRNIARIIVAAIGQIGLLAAASAIAAEPPDPPLPGATRILTLGPDNSTGKAGMIGGVVQPWLSDHEVLHFHRGSLHRFDVTTKTDTLLAPLTRQVKSSSCYLYFLSVAPNGQQVIWGLSANNPLFVSTVDGARREQWDGDGGMTMPYWCEDGRHWMQFHFGGTPTAPRWTKIEMHSLDKPHASEDFPSIPPGLNGLDILAVPSADEIIARTSDAVKFETPKPTESTKHSDSTMSFTFMETPAFRSAQTISVWSLHQSHPLHQWTIKLPGQAQEVAVSPDGKRVAWLLTKGAATSQSLWTSGLDGSGLHEIGVVRPSNRMVHGQWVNFVSQVHWVPGDREVSFIYGDSLWTVTAD